MRRFSVLRAVPAEVYVCDCECECVCGTGQSANRAGGRAFHRPLKRAVAVRVNQCTSVRVCVSVFVYLGQRVVIARNCAQIPQMCIYTYVTTTWLR